MKLCISKSYGKKRVFDNFALEIREGEVLCLLGASGCGKTTLLNILAGLTDCEGELENIPKNAAYIFQEPRLLPNLTVEQNLSYVGGRYEVIEEILQKTELKEHRNKRPNELSGGEKQRVAIARAFVVDSPLLLLDEPFSSLDTALKIRLIAFFAELWREKKQTAVFVTHDLEEAWALGQRIVVIKNGKIALDITPSEQVLPRTYGGGAQEKEEILKALL